MTAQRKKWIAATVAMIALAGCVMVFTRPREPHFEGRSLTYWAARLNQPEAQQALTAIGTNALPFLIDWLDEEPTRFDAWTWRMNNRLPHSLRPNPWPFGARKYIAEHVLGFLGTNAIPAIPALIRNFRWKWAGSSPAFGQVALSEIGPAAIPALMEALEEDPERGHDVLSTLLYMNEPNWQGPRTTQDLLDIVAALTTLSNHPDQDVRLQVASRLLWLEREEIREVVVRVWAKLLRDESSEVRTIAVGRAKLLPPDSPHLDLLMPLRDDSHPNVRAAVERVLQKSGRLGPMPESVAQPSEP